ncbi:MAG: MATE family efflux transporter [Niameybacter sp.]|uniref:MATE family efflux transporter n=1 Tax=Niameybacter sp. TaxID=2033640 RepID=UPI002FC66A96
MERRIDLTEGHMIGKLIKLALPIMGTSFIQMAYNMTDMIWIGRVGSSAVAAVGTAGFFTWLAMAFIMISKVGAEIKVAQSIGEKDLEGTKHYITSAVQVNCVLAIFYGIALLILADPLIGFFQLGDAHIIEMSKTYLVVMALGMVFYFMNPVFTAIFNGLGDSKTPFIINTIGLVFNMVFDPVLILGLGPIPAMGVFGAALATVVAQVVVTVCFIIVLAKRKESYLHINLFAKPEWQAIRTLCVIGFPAAVQSGLFTLFSMVIGRIIAVFGPVPIAVQKVGSQIEAISWMTAGGLSTALGTFTGQNYGAGKYDRIEKGYRVTMGLSIVLGLFATILLVGFGRGLFSIFIPEADAIAGGEVYLRILGYSQLFMCMEITTTGLFNGLGRTYIPSVMSIILTGARIPMAYILSQPNVLGIDGVWWSITISSVVKGLVIVGILIYLVKRNKLYKERVA